MPQNPIVNYFKGKCYTSVEDVLEHTEEISKNMKPTPGPAKLALTDFEKRVAEVAPRYLNGQYNPKEIAVRVLRLSQRSRIARQKIPLPSAIRRIIPKVKKALKKLKKRSSIPITTSHDRPKRLPKLREATGELIEEHRHLIRKVMGCGHKYLPKSLLYYLQRDDAKAVGMDGLVRAIETWDETKGKLNPWARAWIAQAIARTAVKSKKNQMQSLDAPLGEDEDATLYDRKGTPASSLEDREEVEDGLSKLMKSRRTKPHHLALYALHEIYQRNYSEIGRHFNCKGINIKRHLTTARAIIEKVKQREQAEQERRSLRLKG
ncbi:MAG: hypothetical protein V1722_00610 [Candidatus Micrarchaeota archaeon]